MILFYADRVFSNQKVYTDISNEENYLYLLYQYHSNVFSMPSVHLKQNNFLVRLIWFFNVFFFFLVIPLLHSYIMHSQIIVQFSLFFQQITAFPGGVAATTFSFTVNQKHGLKHRPTAEAGTLTWPQ